MYRSNVPIHKYLSHLNGNKSETKQMSLMYNFLIVRILIRYEDN